MTLAYLKDHSRWSRVPGKLDVYLDDPGFLYTASRILEADNKGMLTALGQTTYALFKPDAFAFGKAALALDFLQTKNFEVVATHTLQLTETSMTGLWRYQWNRATPERMAASLSIGLMSPSILVLLRDVGGEGCNIPAAVRLWSLKGSASSDSRTPDRLRSVLGVNGRYFGFVHVPDEPADVVRELTLLLGSRAVLEMLASIDRSRGDIAGELRTQIATFEDRFGMSWCAHAPPTRPNDVTSRISASSVMDWYRELPSPEFLHANVSVRQEAWRRLATAVPLLKDNRDGVRAVIESGGIGDPAHLWSTS
ncbi:MAG: ndk [Massilia sp.]|nr:ndk [Massilia sp.]